jgi:hypothetical protein
MEEDKRSDQQKADDLKARLGKQDEEKNKQTAQEELDELVARLAKYEQEGTLNFKTALICESSDIQDKWSKAWGLDKKDPYELPFDTEILNIRMKSMAISVSGPLPDPLGDTEPFMKNQISRDRKHRRFSIDVVTESDGGRWASKPLDRDGINPASRRI